MKFGGKASGSGPVRPRRRSFRDTTKRGLIRAATYPVRTSGPTSCMKPSVASTTPAAAGFKMSREGSADRGPGEGLNQPRSLLGEVAGHLLRAGAHQQMAAEWSGGYGVDRGNPLTKPRQRPGTHVLPGFKAQTVDAAELGGQIDASDESTLRRGEIPCHSAEAATRSSTRSPSITPAAFASSSVARRPQRGTRQPWRGRLGELIPR